MDINGKFTFLFYFLKELSMESGIDPGQEYYGQDYYSYEHGYVQYFLLLYIPLPLELNNMYL